MEIIQTKFGALTNPPDALERKEPLAFKIKVAQALGLSCVRDGISLDRVKFTSMIGTGYEVLMNINITNTVIGNNTPFVQDFEPYKGKIKSIVDNMDILPEIAVIENEPTNTEFYDGDAKQYVKQLQAACRILRPLGIKVADGGITMPPLKYLYAKSLPLEQGKEVMLRNRLGGDRLMQSAAFTDTLLKNLANMQTDYVNFHWYHSEGDNWDDLIGCINYLQQRTGKPVITNEIGQFDDNPDTTRMIVTIAKSTGLHYLSYYSAKDSSKSKPLHNPDGSLTEIGEAYAAAIKS
jgi:hypothetical protein